MHGQRILSTEPALAGGRLQPYVLAGEIEFRCFSCTYGRRSRRVAVLDDNERQLVCDDCVGPLAASLE